MMGSADSSRTHHVPVATRASFPPRREDRRQTPRGGLVGLGDLEDEDRRHLAVLVVAGLAPRLQWSTPSGPVRCRWHRHFCPFSLRIRDSPLPKNSTPRRGGEGERTSGKGG